MSQDSLVALLGIHDEGLRKVYSYVLETYGHTVTKASTPEEMIGLAKRNIYDSYIMDLNFGKPGSKDIAPAVNIYNLIRSMVDADKSKFVGISGNQEVVDAAKQQEIPAFYKDDFDIIEFVTQPRG